MPDRLFSEIWVANTPMQKVSLPRCVHCKGTWTSGFHCKLSTRKRLVLSLNPCYSDMEAVCPRARLQARHV